MSHPLGFDIPIRLQCFQVPAAWRYKRDDDGQLRFYCSVPERYLCDPWGSKGLRTLVAVGAVARWKGPWSKGILDVKEVESPAITLSPVDPWDLRLRFLNVNVKDPDSVLGFLSEVGYYGPLSRPRNEAQIIAFQGEDGTHAYGYDPSPVTIGDIEGAQEFCRDWPCDLTETSNAVFDAMVAPMAGAPTLFITTASFYDAFQAAFAIDQIRGARIVKCKRPSCGKTFSCTGNRKRKYCSPDCGHYMAVRSHRKRQRKAGKTSRNHKRNKECTHLR